MKTEIEFNQRFLQLFMSYLRRRTVEFFVKLLHFLSQWKSDTCSHYLWCNSLWYGYLLGDSLFQAWPIFSWISRRVRVRAILWRNTGPAIERWKNTSHRVDTHLQETQLLPGGLRGVLWTEYGQMHFILGLLTRSNSHLLLSIRVNSLLILLPLVANDVWHFLFGCTDKFGRRRWHQLPCWGRISVLLGLWGTPWREGERLFHVHY